MIYLSRNSQRSGSCCVVVEGAEEEGVEKRWWTSGVEGSSSPTLAWLLSNEAREKKQTRQSESEGERSHETINKH